MTARTSKAREGGYHVFVSHAGDDIWLAEQFAKCVEECGATTFLDRRDIEVGDKFKERIHEEIPRADELVALFTPWSRNRAWVRHEIGMADMLKKRIVCVFYHVDTADFGADDDGLGPLEGLNIVDINDTAAYFKGLKRRVSKR
ncbi:MAG: toll/interleukin-1 receptor domain-containing protein [Hyphomicrobiaceae bacterium]|nr:toll/interleukin-1 receptor domain-containing protein [Hyphomicrobiaceae bacterium]